MKISEIQHRSAEEFDYDFKKNFSRRNEKISPYLALNHNEQINVDLNPHPENDTWK